MLFLRTCILSLTTLSLAISTTVAAGNTTCTTDSLDWYTNAVGETPCTTYQRLRQICNSAYEVPSVFNPPNPELADLCTDQLSGCCCNSVSYSLMMLCLNCQQGTGTGVGQDFGIDGPDGLYEVYLDGCAPVMNSTMPADIQAAVCNDKIKIEDDLYSLFWGDGDWYYMITRETIQKDQQAYWNNTFTHCPFSLVDNSTHPTLTPSAATTGSTPTGTMLAMQNQTSTSKPWNFLSGGAIAGIVIGSVAPLALVVVFTIWYFGYRKKNDWNYADVQLQPFLLDPSTQERPTSYHPAPLTPGLGSGSGSGPSTPPFAAPYTDVAPPVKPVRSSTALTTQTYISELPQPGPSSYIPHLPYPGPVPSAPRAPIRSPTAQTYDTYVTYPELASPTQDGPPSSTGHSSKSERHADAGVLLARSQSGRLPPAYGEQRDPGQR